MKNLISMNMNINFQWKTEQEENILYAKSDSSAWRKQQQHNDIVR